MKTIAGAGLLRLLEEVAHARGADADDRLDELGRGHREERNVGLAGDGAREQRLARSRRAGEQHAVRDPAAEAAGTSPGLRRKSTTSVSSAFASSIPATSAKVTRVAGRLVAARRATGRTSRARSARSRRVASARTAGRRSRIVGPKPSSRLCHHGAPRVERLGVHDHAFALEQLRERVRVGECRDLGLEERRRLRVLVLSWLRERALDRRALRGDLLHVSRRDLVQEERAVRDPNTRRGCIAAR